MIVFCCPDEPYCRQCSSVKPYTCLQCSQSIYDKDRHKCVTDIGHINNCRQYVLEDKIAKCTKCKDGYTPSIGGVVCVRCVIKDCGLCEDNIYRCDACLGSRIFVNGQCSDDKLCEIENCELCDSETGKCLRCTVNHAFDKQGQCVEFLRHCFKIDKDDRSRCAVCDVGYYITKEGWCKSNKHTVLGPIAIMTIVIFVFIMLLCLFVYGLNKCKNRHVRFIDMSEHDEQLFMD